VLPVATSALARSCVATRRDDALWRGAKDLDGIRAEERLRLLGDESTHELTWQRVTHEDDSSIGASCDTSAARCDVSRL